ncbi:MAG TPA: AsmA family protein [Candidatus Koribacter sp.]|jgi:AsmA protein
MKKKILLILAAAVVLALITLAVLPHFINANSFKPRVQDQLTKALGRPVTIGDLSASIFSGGVTASGITIADDPSFGEQPFIQAKSLKIGLDMSALIFSRKLKIHSLTLEDPQVHLLQDQAGHWNFASLGGQKNSATGKPGATSSAGDELSVDKVAVENGSIAFGRVGESTRNYTGVQLTATDLSYTTAFPFHCTAKTPGNGSLDLDGKTGPINQQNAAATPLQAKVTMKDLNIGETGFTDPKSGVAGTADFSGTIDSNGMQVQTQGEATIKNGKFVPAGQPSKVPIGLRFDATYAIASETAEIKTATVNIGKASAQLTGTLDNKPASPILNLKITGSGMPVDALQDAMPAVGVVLPPSAKLQSGTAGVNVELTGPLDDATTTGSASLHNAVLANFDLGSKMKGIGSLAGISSSKNTEIQSFSTNLKHNNKTGSDFTSLDVVIPSIGSITGQGTISPANELDFNLLVKLSGKSAVGILTQVTGAAGSKGIPVNVKGTAQNPQFSPDMGSMVKNMNPVNRVSKPATGLVKDLFGKKQK